LFLLLSLAGKAQPYKVDFYAQEKGLKNELIKSLTIDTLGFIWAGTDYGIARFNGNEFIDFADDLSSDYVKSIICTNDGSLFVNTDLGFEQINYGNKPVKSTLILKGSAQKTDSLLWYPKQFFEDTKKNLWFSDNIAVYRYNEKRLHRYYLGPENTPESFVHSFSFFENGFNNLIMISNTGNFYRYDYMNNAISPIFGNFDVQNVTGVQKISDGHILIGFNNMLGEMFFDADSRFISFQILNSTLDVSSFLQKSDGSVFIGTWTQGLWQADLINNRTYLTNIDPLNDKGAINQIVSYHNEFLLATDYGVAILQKQDFISPFNDVCNSFIQDVEYDKVNKKILFTDGKKIYSVDEESLIEESIFTSPGYTILQVLPDGQYLWFSDNRGILRKSINGNIIKTIDLSQYGTSIYYLIFDDEKNLWLCQDGLNGVIQIKQENSITLYGENQGLNSQVNFIKTTPYTHLVLGTNSPDKFLLYFNSLNDTILNMSEPVKMDSDLPFSVNDIAFDENKVLWLAGFNIFIPPFHTFLFFLSFRFINLPVV